MVRCFVRIASGGEGTMHTYRQSNFGKQITALGKDFSHTRVATVKNALCDTSGLIVDSATCRVFRNGGCDIAK